MQPVENRQKFVCVVVTSPVQTGEQQAEKT